MKRNVVVSIAAALMAAAALAQAEDRLVAGEFVAENLIIEGSGATGPGGGSYEDPDWKEQVPFPRHFGPAVD